MSDVFIQVSNSIEKIDIEVNEKGIKGDSGEGGRELIAIAPITVQLTNNSNVISIAPAGMSVNGYLASNDFSSFQNKAESNHNHGNLALTNIVGTSGSNGLSLSAMISPSGNNIPISASNQSSIVETVIFGNSNGVSFGLSNGTIVGSINTNYVNLSQSSQFLQTNEITNFVAISNSSNFINTSQSSIFMPNANSTAFMNVNISSSIMPLGSGSSFMSTSERNNYFHTSNRTFANSTHEHGNLALTNISGTSASNGLSLSAANQTQQPMYFGANGSTFGHNTLLFGNSNGVSFSLSNGSVVGSVATNYIPINSTSNLMNTNERNNYFYSSNNTFANSTHTHGNIVLALTNISGTTLSASNGLTLSLSANSSGGTGPTVSGIVLSAEGGIVQQGTVIFSNSNGMAFGLNGNTVTGSYTVPAQSYQPIVYSAQAITSSANTLRFGSMNGVTFEISNNSIIASVRTDYMSSANSSNFIQTNQSSLFLLTNNSSTFMLTVDSTNLVNTSERNNYYYTSNNTFAHSTHSHGNPVLALTNILGTTASGSNGLTLSLSVSSGGAGDGGNVIAVNGSTANSTGTIIFSNSNGISFGLNGNTITASYTVPAQSYQPVAYSATNGTGTANTLIFANSGGVSFSTGTQGIYATVVTNYMASASSSIFIRTSQSSLFALQANTTSFMLTGERNNYFYTSNNTFANSTHSHGNPLLALTNISGTTASGSNGLSLSLSAFSANSILYGTGSPPSTVGLPDGTLYIRYT